MSTYLPMNRRVCPEVQSLCLCFYILTETLCLLYGCYGYYLYDSVSGLEDKRRRARDHTRARKRLKGQQEEQRTLSEYMKIIQTSIRNDRVHTRIPLSSLT